MSDNKIASGLPPIYMPELALSDSADAQAQLVAEALRGARQSRRLASESRQQAQQENIDKLRVAADKLREMANLSQISGVIQGVTGFVTGCLSFAQAGKGVSEATQKSLDGCTKILDGFARADLPGRASAQVDADKRELEIAAEQAGKRADDARDQMGEADRVGNSLREQLSRLYDARQAGYSAVVRG